MPMKKRISYGVADYEELVRDNAYFVDKTHYIEKLELVFYRSHVLRGNAFLTLCVISFSSKLKGITTCLSQGGKPNIFLIATSGRKASLRHSHVKRGNENHTPPNPLHLEMI